MPCRCCSPVVPLVVRFCWFPGHRVLPGMILSPEAEQFPQKIVDKARAGHFVEMELLADNMALISQLKAVQGLPPIAMFGAARPRLQEVNSLSTWCYCFLATWPYVLQTWLPVTS